MQRQHPQIAEASSSPPPPSGRLCRCCNATPPSHALQAALALHSPKSRRGAGGGDKRSCTGEGPWGGGGGGLRWSGGGGRTLAIPLPPTRHLQETHAQWGLSATQHLPPVLPKRRFQGPISTFRRAQLVPHRSPWLSTHSHCHRMIIQQRPNGLLGSLGSAPNDDCSAKPCRSEEGCPHWGGGPEGGRSWKVGDGSRDPVVG